MRFTHVLIATAATAMLSAGVNAQTTLLLNSFLAPQHPVTRVVIKPWAEKVTAATEGRVKIDLAPNSLAAPPQQVASVTKGVFDIAYQFHGLMAEQVKLNQVAHLPFVNTTSRGSSMALWRTYERYFSKANELADVQVLAMFVLPPGVSYGMDKPVLSLADLKGQKVYGLPGVPAKVLEAAGAGVVAAPAARSYEIISGKTVDAFVGYSVSDADGLKTLPYAKHVTDVPGNLTAPSFVLFMSKKRWDALPAKDREVIRSLSGEAFARNMAIYDELETKARTAAAASGIKFHQASNAFTQDLRKLASPLTEAWLADASKLGVNGKEALEFYIAQAKANQ
jgi:TRAP-type C4-dicarboxylate transport system substrate-binding protein